MARKLAAAHGLGEDDVIVDRAALEELQGALYCLEAAVEDVDRDLAGPATASEVADALRWLLENARPLAEEWSAAVETLTVRASTRVAAADDVPKWLARTSRRPTRIDPADVVAALDESRGEWPDR
jgi:hypothetical protein